MKEQASRVSRPSSALLRWVINILWILVWTVLFFLCIKVFGDTVGLVGVILLILLGIGVWYVTERRHEGTQERAE